MRMSEAFVKGTLAFIFAITAISSASISRGDASVVPHLQLSISQPGADSTVVAAPKELKLWFSEQVHLAMTSVRLRGSDSSVVALGPAKQDKAAGSPVVFPVTGAMKPGSYVLVWKTMGNDGHAVDGQFKFTVKAAD